MEKIIVKRNELIEKMLWWQEKGLQYTRTGYGSKIPSLFMVKLNGRLHRIYFACYSNLGTSYVIMNGKKNLIDVDC